jgi:hypothetical protein
VTFVKLWILSRLIFWMLLICAGLRRFFPGTSCGFVPAAVFIEARMSPDGADDGVGSRRNAAGLFDDEAEGMSHLSGALAEESKGMSVTVNGAAVTQVEFEGRLGGAAPMEKVLLDGGAVGVLADRAANPMIGEIEGAGRVAARSTVRLRWRGIR